MNRKETSDLKITSFKGHKNKELNQAVDNLKKYNRSFTGPFESEHFGFIMKDKDGELIAAIHANTEWEWIFIKHLWVKQHARTKGIGTLMMNEIIKEANRRNIYKYYLTTFEFQAPGFYKKLGFEMFGTLPNVSGNYDSYFLKREDK